MPTFDHETEIAAPIEYVFDWGDGSGQLAPIDLVDDRHRAHRGDRRGLHYRNTMKVLGRTMISDELFTIDEENFETLSVFDDEAMSGEMRFTYTETEDGTHVRMHGDIDTGGSLFDRAVQPVLKRFMNRQFRNSLQTMKELIEVEIAAEPAAAA